MTNKELIQIKEQVKLPRENFYKNWLEDKIISWLVCDKIYRKGLFSTLRFNEGMIYEDNYLVADILDISKKIFISNAGIYYYWRRTNSTTTKKHSLKKDIDTQKVNLHILDKIKSIKNLTNSKVIILSKIFYVYTSIYKNFNYQPIPDELFVEELKKISFISILKSKLTYNQILKIVLVKIIGVEFYLNKYVLYEN
jgi:hypothetical protein